MASPRLAILFVEYDNEKYPDSFNRLKFFVDKIPNADKRYYVVDNMKEGDYVRCGADGTYRLGGNNSDWEFSGWQRGLDVLQKERIPYDAVLFANDAFMAYGWSFLQTHSSINLVDYAITHNAAIGQIDTKGVPLDAFGRDVSSWICTNCFLLPRTIVQNIGQIVSIDEAGMERVVGKYNGEEVLAERAMTAQDRSFELVCRLTPGLALRFEGDKSFVPDGGRDARELCLIIDSIACGETFQQDGAIVSGFFDKEGEFRWMKKDARIEFTKDVRGLLRVCGHVPIDVLQKKYAGQLVLKVYRTTPLFVSSAPVGASYRQMVVRWLTEEWHSRLQISDQNWDFLRRKVKSMLNESLLTARIREKGFRVESYKNLPQPV